jgi:hypothetical protein
MMMNVELSVEWELWGNRSTRREPAPVPLCPPKIPQDLSWARIQTAAVGSQQLTVWAMARPLIEINFILSFDPKWSLPFKFFDVNFVNISHFFHLMHFELITPTILGRYYEPWGFSLCNFLHTSQYLSFYYSQSVVRVKDQVSHSYRTKQRVKLCFPIF